MVDAGSDAQQHPAYLRWRESGAAGPAPRAVRRFHTHPGSSEVYMLEGVGAGGAPVIAKRARSASIAREIMIQDRLLPEIGLPATKCFGVVTEDDGGHSWLFMEYLEGREPRWSPDDRIAAARWLAMLHSVSSEMDLTDALPSVGADRYLAFLGSAQHRLIDALERPRLAGHAGQLERLSGLVRDISEGWSEIERRFADFPSALMHGDFIPKNIRLIDRGGASTFYVLDWESAGWGPPVEDISVVDLQTYRGAIEGPWAVMCSERLDEMHAVGTISRYIAWIQAETAALSTDWVDESLSDLAHYEADLKTAWSELASA